MDKNISVWLIIPQTNLHVGNEGVGTFSVIDKAIQRDVTTNLPCINSSSLKGAIKEYLISQKKFNVSSETIMRLFGSLKDDSSTNSQKGLATFFDASLLFLPVQSDAHLYDLIYSEDILNMFVRKVQILGYNDFTESKIKEKVTYNHKEAVDTDEFIDRCNDESLPIIARNCLDNGQSSNLWYEQVLPSMSVLATIIKTPSNETLDILDGQIVQIGANATIGYGFCKFIRIK